MKTLCIIDGYSLAYRYFFASQKTDALILPDGTPISISAAVVSSINHIIKTYKATSLYFAYDTSKPTFRHKIYPNYKANRKHNERTEKFKIDFANLIKILDKLDIQTCSIDDYEADDVIASIVKLSASDYDQTFIFTSDQDIFQLIDDSKNIKVVTPSVIVDADYVERNLCVKPSQIRLLKALRGDVSDNIQGIYGIGRNRAFKLIKDCETLEEFKHSVLEQKLTPSVRKALVDGWDSLDKYYVLTGLVDELPVELPKGLSDATLETLQLLQNTKQLMDFMQAYITCN